MNCVQVQRSLTSTPRLSDVQGSWGNQPDRYCDGLGRAAYVAVNMADEFRLHDSRDTSLPEDQE